MIIAFQLGRRRTLLVAWTRQAGSFDVVAGGVWRLAGG
jgi:hypothetical protein